MGVYVALRVDGRMHTATRNETLVRLIHANFSVLAAFHYGSFMRPSQNPPRVGLLSTVDANAGKQLCDDKHRAEVEHEGYPSTSLLSILFLP